MFKRLISYLQLSRDRIRRWLGLKLFDAKSLSSVEDQIPRKIVLLRWDAKWGDAIVSSFVFNAIRSAYPNAQIDLVTTPEMAGLFRDYYDVDKVHEIKKRPKYSALRELAVSLGDVDVLVHLSPTLKMKDLYFLNKVGARTVAGLDDEANHINLKLGKVTQGVHFAEKFRLLLEAIGVKTECMKYQIPLDPQSQQQVKTLLETRPDAPLIVFNPYGSGGSRKMNADTINQVLDNVFMLAPNVQVALLHMPDTEQEVAAICDARKGNKVFYNENSRSIYDAIALVAVADKVISVDTAIVHVASGLEKPLLGVYNPDPDNFAAWHPNSDKAVTMFAEQCNPPDINALDPQKLLNSLKRCIAG